ncbi:MAG TPA: hypothetical protein VD927_06720 [Chryseosolibacter sp.]|nr:hypothetical protein [Chryseosolibacter sp.]
MNVQSELFNRTTTQSFYNTISATGKDKIRREQKAGSQDKIVLDFFTITPPYKFTASQVTNHLHAQGHKFLKDSVKRSMSTLSSKELERPFLRITKNRIMGPHGSPEHIYELIR